VPTAVGAVVDEEYVVPPVPTYVYVAPEIASGFERVPVVTDTVGDTAEL
jgi:hypothetical protein